MTFQLIPLLLVCTITMITTSEILYRVKVSPRSWHSLLPFIPPLSASHSSSTLHYDTHVHYSSVQNTLDKELNLSSMFWTSLALRCSIISRTQPFTWINARSVLTALLFFYSSLSCRALLCIIVSQYLYLESDNRTYLASDVLYHVLAHLQVYTVLLSAQQSMSTHL